MAGGVYDGLSAAVVEQAGFGALALSGAGVAAAAGLPDLGLLSFGELMTAARTVIAGAGVPVLVDADTGFGNELNVARTCGELAAAGAGGVMIEDQTFPKRCGHLTGKAVVPAGEFESKLRAARRALGPEPVLVARTDALAVDGLDDAVERCLRALDAGADVTFVEAPPDLAAAQEVAARVPGVKLYNLATGGRSPSLPFDELEGLGYGLVVVPGVALMPALRAIKDAAAAVLASGSDSPLAGYGVSPRAIFETVGLDRWLAIDAAVRS